MKEPVRGSDGDLETLAKLKSSSLVASSGAFSEKCSEALGLSFVSLVRRRCDASVLPSPSLDLLSCTPCQPQPA